MKERTNLYAFDVDGTLTISNGLVPSEWLYFLKEKGSIVGFAGNHGKALQSGLIDFDFYERGDIESLKEVKRRFKADLYVHVGDGGEDKVNAKQAGYTFVFAEDFRLPLSISTKSNPKVENAIIIAGGFGTRLNPITSVVPKALLPYKDRFIIDYMVENIRRAGIENIILTTNSYYQQAFERWNKLGDVRIIYEDELTGSLNSLYEAAKELGFPDLLISHGNSYTTLNYNDFINAWDEKSVLASGSWQPAKEANRFGVIEAYNGRIREYREKPKSVSKREVLIGCDPYVFPKSGFPILKEFIELNKGKFTRFGHFFSYLVEKKIPIEVYVYDGLFAHIDYPKSYIDLWRHF